ncbi:DNA-binding transcription repressor [Podila verticillata]|nr:DNA-binding transcription repressor [Podila verticillata]
MSGAILPPPALGSSTMTEPRKPVRVSLNRIQDLAANGTVRFSQGDIQLFRQRGILRSDAVVDGPTSTSVSRPAPEDSRSNLSTSITATSRLTTKASYTTNTLQHTRQRHDRRHSSHHRMVISPSKQTLPPYHNQTFEDTCSHLNPMHPEYLGSPGNLAFDTLVGFRRHSESSFMASPTPGSPVPSATSKSPRPSLPGNHFSPPNMGPPDYLSHLRRASTSSSPIVPSPLGNRTVLYAASSPAHTLLSLPAKPIVEEPRTNHSTAMNNFKFPADGPTTETALPPSPSSPPIASAILPVPSMPTQALTRSKRKSVPMRSPSWTDSQDVSPGVIFQLPFGYPTSKSSPALPSSNYPSPASSTQALLESSGSEPQLFQPEVPQSPVCRNGLGIQVDGSFTEPGATHPLEPSMPSMEEDSTISIGDIIMAEQASMAAQRQRPNGSLFEDHYGQDSIPTPPMTSRVFPLQIMETISEQQQEQDDTNRPQPMEAIEMTPRTPGHPIPQSVVEQEAPVPPTPADDTNRENPVQGITSKDGVDLAPEDPSLLPLRAQRQLSIRRQSLIPRPELDFVRGSGILPPASKDLVTRGGATILTYPVLLSDMVQVAMDDAVPKGDESSNESPEEPSESTPASHGSKRKKGHGKRRAALITNGAAHDDHLDVQDGYVSNPEDSRPKAPRRRVSPMSSYSAHQTTNRLGSPIELSEASFGTSKRRSKSTLSRQYEYQDWEEPMDENVENIVDDVDYNIEDLDDEDSGNEHGSYEQPHQSHHKKKPVLEKLRPGEVELAMQHAREMMRVYDPAHHAMKTLQPLLDAIQSEEDEDDHLMETTNKGTKASKKAKAATPRKRSINDASEDAPKKARKKSTDGNGGAKRGRKAGSSKKNNDSGSPNGGSHGSHDDSEHDHDEDGKLASPVKKRESKIKLFGRQTAKHCEACGADDTPCWRPGYIGNTVLCNSCGLRYKKSNVFCTKVDCKYIPLKTEYASMEAERIKNGRDHLRCINCKGNVALPIPKA